ncbi:hypothetical protein GCM10022225_83570 [Plantactinospora mayteni]|uniref:Bacteriocin biosynthesis cyclodehydratase domain-containing protein n=1 Tax=Plantactinospora mayteni TaxID=566021 RepID=A0ABQ4F4H2_9ACTN|nr:hypothetical protein [Plantactinospora mayteni]GIH01811.1 hypothetical protein Pma05_83830 [Plantactinospora mayteni]
MSEYGSAQVRLVTGLAVVEAEDSLVVTGTLRRQVFRGRAATTVLPRLLPLLDGVRDPEQICRELGLAPRQLTKMMALLDRSGLLDHPDAEPAPPVVSDEVVSYYGRIKDSAGYPGTGELLARLARARVTVVADEDVAARITDDLRASGVGTVRPLAGPPAGDAPAGYAFAETDLIVAVGTGTGARELLAAAESGAAEWDVPVLRVFLGDGHLEIGPYLLPDFSTCLECLDRSRRDAGWDTGPDGALPPDALEFAAGMAASEAVSMLAGITGMKPVQRVARIGFDDFETEHFVAAPYPDCRRCGAGVAGRTLSPEVTAIERYEWWIQHDPAVLQPRKAERGAAVDRIAGLERERPRLSSHPRQALADVDQPVRGTFGQREGVQHPSAVTEELLGELLRRVGGQRRAVGAYELQRWTPTGGNLASVEVHLLRETGFAGLPGTVFRYDDVPHAMTATRPDAVPAAELLAGTDLLASTTYAAVLVLVAAHGRNAGKYHHSHRLVHLDAGCAVTQLDAVATGYGWRTEWARSWDERIGDVLRLHRRDQFVTAVVGIRDQHQEEGSACR